MLLNLGGAFIVGSPATHDTIQANLCLSSGCAVLSVDYSLAPEELYPTPYKEGHQVLQWVQQHGHEKHNLDGKNVSVIGDSAGGTCDDHAPHRVGEGGGEHNSLLSMSSCDQVTRPAV